MSLRTTKSQWGTEGILLHELSKHKNKDVLPTLRVNCATSKPSNFDIGWTGRTGIIIT
jgi:hypothetical protein